jgi:hypothetical protein
MSAQPLDKSFHLDYLCILAWTCSAKQIILAFVRLVIGSFNLEVGDRSTSKMFVKNKRDTKIVTRWWQQGLTPTLQLSNITRYEFRNIEVSVCERLTLQPLKSNLNPPNPIT